VRSYVIPAPKKMSREHKGIQSNQVAQSNKEVLPETKEQAYQKKFAMIQAAFHSVAGFDDGSDKPKTTRKC
jgi:hypothetical protein